MTDTLRFAVAGPRPPPIERAPEVAERARRATLGQARRLFGPDRIPAVLSGHGPDGPHRGHRHAFWLPEDDDDDGLVDHLTVHVPGMDDAALASLFTVDIALGSREESWRAERGWSGRSADPDVPGRLLGSARAWTSLTPYVGPWHEKPRLTQPDMLRRECALRGLPPPAEITPAGTGGPVRPVLRWRWRGSTPPGPGTGARWRLVFGEPVRGPLALGYGCHFGLGVFGRERDGARG